MRFEFFATTYKIFWNNETENKPDSYFFNALRWTPIKKQIRYTSQTTAEMITDDNTITMVKVVDTLNNASNRFYYVNSYDKETDNTIKYNLTLDIWATFVLPFLAENQDTPVDYLRSHIKNKNAFQLEDRLLNNIAITYKQKTFNRFLYNFSENDTKFFYDLQPHGTYTERRIEIDKDDIINGNLCYVFSGGLDTTNDEYIFIPILANKKRPTIRVGQVSQGEAIDVIRFNTNGQLAGAQLQYDRILRLNPNALINITPAEIPSGTQPFMFTCSIYQYQKKAPAGGINPPLFWGESWTEQTLHVNNVLMYSTNTVARSPSPVQSEAVKYPPYPKPIEVVYSFHNPNGSPIYSEQEINNTISLVDSLKNNVELINKFVGVYFLPNFLNFYRDIEIAKSSAFKDYLYFKITPNGVPISGLTLSSFPVVVNKDKYNSTTINNDVILKYYNISYFNNHKNNWNYWLINNQISLSGLFVFNGCPSIICFLDNLKTSDSVIAYPYQLPSSTDGYIKYYSGIMSSINNGIKQQEISYNLNKAQTGLNFLNGLSSVVKSPSASGVLNLTGSTTMGIARNEQQNNAFKNNLQAQNEDVKRTTSTSFAPSNISDTATILSNFSFSKNCESLEIWVPDDNSLRLLNNVLFLYGTLYPDSKPLKDLTPREFFNYIQIDKGWLATWIPSLTNYPQNIKSAIIEILAQGVRIWKVRPSFNVEN